MALGTIISGVKGSVTIPTTPLAFTTDAVDTRIIRWSLSIAREEHDTTVFNASVTNNFRTFVGGMASFTGRCEGYLDSGQSVNIALLQVEDQAPTATFVMTATTSRTYTFSALITGIDLGIDKGAHSALSFTYRGSGVIAVA